MANSSTWQRIHRQTLTLIHKNLLIFYRAPISTVLRALVFPIVFTVIMSVLKNINATAPTGYTVPKGAIASGPTPILDLDVAIESCSSKRLVFVRNGMSRREHPFFYLRRGARI
jgi:ATP-binding cassette subfamily A (ABC1) protein 3